jgi:hypothetical protein
MAPEPGKYDDLCTHVREQACADGAVVVIFGGKFGSGFSVQVGDRAPNLARKLPEILRAMARQIEESAG